MGNQGALSATEAPAVCGTEDRRQHSMAAWRHGGVLQRRDPHWIIF